MEIPVEPKFAKSLRTKELPSLTDRHCILGDVNRLNLLGISFIIVSGITKICFNCKYMYLRVLDQSVNCFYIKTKEMKANYSINDHHGFQNYKNQ